jgi:hypothetical protein
MKLSRTLVFASLLATATVALPGCGNTTAVLNYENQPIYKAQSGPYTLEQVRDKIAAGVTARKWGIEDESRGWMVARVTSGGHWAKVRITYDTEKYTIIHFESSPGLKWNGDRIHRRYNNWVKNLNASIEKQFLLAQAPPPADETAPADAPASEGPAIDNAPEPDPSWNEGE